jgi:predicted metalloprotease with PDZ domain
VENSVWNIIDLPSSDAAHHGTVGFGFLKHFNITIDYGRRRVWLENWSGKTTDEPVGEPGFRAFFDRTSKKWLVFFVMENGPAAKAGMKVGDELLSLDGKEYGNIGYDRMAQLLEGKVGSKIETTVSRKGDVRRFTVDRIEMINDPKKL